MSRRAVLAIIAAAITAAAAVAAARWWRGFEWGSRERIRYDWALRARLAGRYAWGRPAEDQPPVTTGELDADLASAARDLSSFERAVITYRILRQAQS